jgi:membrane protease YdiL (CAAX protease family)
MRLMSATDTSDAALPTGPSYWSLSRQPLASLWFICPFLVAYEVGIIVLGPHAVRNGAEAWLRCFLDWIGFGQYFLLPVLTVSVLLGWHHTTHQPWRVPRGVFWGMAVESVLLAICLRAILHLQGLLLEVPAGMTAVGSVQYLVQFIRIGISYLGAGIYEELLFRVLLLSLALWLLRSLRWPHAIRLMLAVLVTSLLFSAAHYVGGREPIAWFSFSFRFIAGVFFATLFVYRGFGIAAGAHAGYDILVGLM